MSFIKIIDRLFFVLLLISLSFFICKTAKALEPVKIALISSETGIAAKPGKPMVQGAKMAVDEINSQG
ncbi:MAG: ABC transporter substrate-binding protein, partial [Desulfobacteraceae bacterium]|nr:ABC transporter substrate-binding protein [Desulfobacteraceae bacterium]